ncbi:MAG: DNA polymerase IV [Coriobacteriia bacterium]|nr:DNA polymerase IV [Coriobacteriia bacterium]
MADRVILHSDMNCFYANVECFHNPELRDKPVAVGGDEDSRHGIVLAKNEIAKKCGVKSGETLWSARSKCPALVVVPPNYRLYLEYSRLAREIYYDYTDQVEPFGPDEAWLDLTGSMRLLGRPPLTIAQEISQRVKSELGVTVSIGVSWNKVFAKFGSDYKKPDAITCITRENYREIVWNAPAEEMLYVGPATKKKLAACAIFTIGEIAQASTVRLTNRLGKMGYILQSFARGEDSSPVKVLDPLRSGVDYEMKSIGNGLTTPHDITTRSDAKALVYLLAESVAHRMREHKVKARTVSVSPRTSDDLHSFTRQAKLVAPSNITAEIAACAFRLLEENHHIDDFHPLRAISIRASDFVDADAPMQLDLFLPEADRCRMECLDTAIDELRRRFGNHIVRRATSLCNTSINEADVKRDNIIHPIGFFNN